jgi:hypothetical protein
MSNIQLKEVAKEATNKEFFNSFATASKVTSLIGFFGQFISGLTEFHFVFSALGGVYDSTITIKTFLAALGGLVAVYIFEVVGVRIYLVKIIRQIVNKDFTGSERKVLFVFNLLFVLALCGTNLLTSWLGQKYSFESVTNVTTTDKTHKLEAQKSSEVATVTARYDDKANDLKTTYSNEVATVTARYDNDNKELKNSRYTHRENKAKYDSYTIKIDNNIILKTNYLTVLKKELDNNITTLNNDRKTEINDIKQMFTTRINDVSNVENSKINLIATVQKYTLPILIIFILLSWFAIVYNEIFIKGSGQKIEVIEVEKRPLLIVEFFAGLYEKIYQMFYWIVAKFLGSKQYQFGAIKQDVVKYDIKQKTIKKTSVNDFSIAAIANEKVRQIGFNRNVNDNQNDNQTDSVNINDVTNFIKLPVNDLSTKKAMNLMSNDNRITKVVTVKIEGNRTCKNCGNGFTYKHHKQMYCTTECRIENWETRTGKTLNKKAKK